MSLINRLVEKLQRHPKRVVFPEGTDPRILQAARQFATKRLGVPILLGDRAEIKDKATRLDIRLDGIRIIEPGRSDDLDQFLVQFKGLQRFRGLKEVEARETVLNNNYFATMMVATGRADAIVSGATVSASSALRPIFQIIPLQDHVASASSMLILDMENEKIGINGVLFLADCGVIPEPTEEQLSSIAVTTAAIGNHLTNETPRVAMLSFSTKSKYGKHKSVIKVRAAAELAREKAKLKNVKMEIEGELQVDAALDAMAAELKGLENSSVAGKANVLVFPDLNSGNIASKMVQILAGARSYGQIITGLTRPCAEISRGASAHDIFGTAVIVACQSIDPRLLYGTDFNKDK